MKKITLYVLIVFFSHNSYSQNIFEEYWHISEVIGQDTENTKEYILYKIDKNDKYSLYGTKIIFNSNNSFICNYSAKCGNDCFPSSVGTYKIIDNKHINLFVKQFKQSGDCESKKSISNLEMGKYFLSQKSDKIIKLIKSDGNSFQDSLNEKYSNMIDKYIEDVKYGSSNLLNFKTELKGNLGRVNLYIKNRTRIKNFRIVYSKKQDDTFIINLVKNEDEKNDYFFIINGFRNEFECQVGYYKFI
ncbi:hypothetical protein KHA90_00970 [Flavobacterium psychroterrae]|uniref:Lipocalin-like domain-containing protein n=1 Tax=Flavobacterium psychroterrae TaxID=2133767 RepID=A0ABS5P742_9FLAO|nr:hypothetical protein [Flavobacterium psychroterrae]MBS7229581.1 hypothetical protein [Flavobacterium psychroterrae]